MQIDQSVVDALVAQPAEGLTVEVKRWLDPGANAGIEKIVKAALAFRNRNGGYLVIGFDDGTLLPNLGSEPANVRDAFHLDTIQGLVSRYSSELFEIGVGFCQRDGVEYPVIVVPPGVRTPVAAKRDLMDGGKTLIRHGAVYFRTLSSNGTPSTSETRPEDWRDIVEICFDNREADVGRFLRRQLGGGDVAAFVAALQAIGLAGNAPAAPTLRDRCEALLRDGDARYQVVLQTRTLDAEGSRLVAAGAWSVALVIDPPKSDARPDRTFASIIAASNPKLTGWPVWLDSSASSTPENRPKVGDNALEALIISALSGWSNHLDFMRLDPSGEFFLRRVLQDDGVPSKVTPGTVLDPILVVLRVAEAIIVGMAFAKANPCHRNVNPKRVFSGGQPSGMSLAYPYPMWPLRFRKQVAVMFSQRVVQVFKENTLTLCDLCSTEMNDKSHATFNSTLICTIRLARPAFDRRDFRVF